MNPSDPGGKEAGSGIFAFPPGLRGYRVHLVGAKGTGVCAFAELLVASGAVCSGSDVADEFYTDSILRALGIPVSGFDAANISADIDVVIHSAAYGKESNPELMAAVARGIPVVSYPDALGAFSRSRDSSGIAGVHGKTTTTAIAGTILKGTSFPACVLAGSAVSNFGDRSTMHGGDEYFVAETCEYRRHFLSFSPARILLTSVESDHQDYYPTFASILQAFVEYIRSLPAGGLVIYCHDDPGALEAVRTARRDRPDVVAVPYGFDAPGTYRLEDYRVSDERVRFRMRGVDGEFSLAVPGRHIALDAAGAYALCETLYGARNGSGRYPPEVARLAMDAIASFRGSKRRSERLGEGKGVVFMDDYAHHPTAIRLTVRGIRELFPGRRIVVDFMPHTYSRTKALFADFAAAFDEADELVMHRIYASAREEPDPLVTGRSLFEAAAERARKASYFEDPMDAEAYLSGSLMKGDLFITMGAGDNWKLSHSLRDRFAERPGAGGERQST